MDDKLLATLQAAADDVMPGLAQLRLVTHSEVVYEPDPRKGREGRNRLARRTECETCKATGELLDEEKLPIVCAECGGDGYTETEDRHEVITVVIDIGHAVETSFSLLEGKGRVDRRRARTIEEAVKLVTAQVGAAAYDTLLQHHAHLTPERAQTLAIAALAVGHDAGEVKTRLARHEKKGK